MAIRIAASKTVVTITEYVGTKRYNYYHTTEYVKVQVGSAKPREYRLENLVADGGQTEMDAAIAQAKRNTVANRMTDTRKRALLNAYENVATNGHINNSNRDRIPSTAFDWLNKNGLIARGEGWTYILSDDALVMARDLYIAERGIVAFWQAMAQYINNTSGITGFMALLRAIPTMLATQQFATDLNVSGWTVTPRNGHRYEANWGGNDVQVSISVQPSFRRIIEDEAPDQYTINLRPNAQNKLSVIHARLISRLLADAAVLANRLNETLEA